jgi:hypothetical protein
MEMSEQHSQHQAAPPDWFRTADGLVRLIVLKQFHFILTRTRSRTFAAGEHLLDPNNAEDAAVLNHRWICEDFADGHIESPQKTREGLEAQAAKADAARARHEALQRETAAALGLAP